MTQARSALNWLLNKHHTLQKAADSTYKQPVPPALSKKDTTVNSAFRLGVQVTRRKKQKTVTVGDEARTPHRKKKQRRRESNPYSDDEEEEASAGEQQHESPVKLSDPLKGKIRRMIPEECMERAMRWYVSHLSNQNWHWHWQWSWQCELSLALAVALPVLLAVVGTVVVALALALELAV